MTTRILTLASILAVGLLAGGRAFAQGTPAPASSPTPTPPGIVLPNAQALNEIINQAVRAFQDNIEQGILNRQNDVTGTVTYFHRFDLQIQTGNSLYRSVHLHQGTIINPTGTTLRNGMKVRVRGVSQSDGSLNADEIDVVSS